MRKTKIIATIGPKWADRNIIKEMMTEGVDIFRLNFSFATHEEHLERINLIRSVSKDMSKSVAILADLQGPKIRVGVLKEPIFVNIGDTIVLSGYEKVDNDSIIPTTHINIANDVKKGSMLLIADGTIRLIVESSNKDKKLVTCKVMVGGTIISGKGINLPGSHVTTKVLTKKDVSDAIFAAKNGVNYLGLSFVRDKNDVINMKNILKNEGIEDIGIISKIENTQALENLKSIIEVSNGVMVARGDLGVEIPFSRVPIEQKHILNIAGSLGKLTIIATQMLESMTKNPIPTRAEASDVANAVLDGADVVMMSAETAFGDYPIEAVRAMVNIVETIETTMYKNKVEYSHKTNSITSSLSESASYLSYCLDNKVIIVLSVSGKMVRAISKKRPKTPIVFISSNVKLCEYLSMWHNVCAICTPEEVKLDKAKGYSESIDSIEKILMKHNIVKSKDRAIVVSGSKWKGKWQENSIRVVTICEMS